MKKGFLMVALVALFGLGLSFNFAHASTVIDFGTGSAWGGKITESYEGGVYNYVGSGIALDALKVQVDGGSPTLYGLDGAVLFNGKSAASLDFSTKDDTITVTGYATDLAGNPLSTSGILLTGSFTSWSLSKVGMVISFSASGQDEKTELLLASLGLSALVGAPWEFTGFVISIDWKPGKGYYEAVSTDIVNTTNAVPVPGAVWLFGSGLLGLLSLRRKST